MRQDHVTRWRHAPRPPQTAAATRAPSVRALAGRPLAILAAAALLVWPAFMNGYPILFIDTVSYLVHTITGQAPWDKTVAYGPFIALFHQERTLWLPLIAQGLLLSHLLWLTQRVACGEVTPARHLALAAGLAALTSAPWFAATLMPDFFTPVVVLCLFLLGFGETRLGRLEIAWTALLAAVGIATHLSHLPTALALVALMPLLRRSWRPLLRVAPPVAAATLFLVGANWYAFGRATLSAHGSVFLLARLQADGPATWTLRERCPASGGWYLCGFLDRLPMDSDRFLWDPDSPPSRDAAGNPRPWGFVTLAPEAREVVAATLRDHPLAVARAALGNAVEQLFKVRLGDTLEYPQLRIMHTWDIWDAFPPRELSRFRAGAQARGELERLAAPAAALQLPVLVLSLVLALAGCWRLACNGDTSRLGLLLCVLVGLAANAFTTGALSKPHHRYQARIVWLLPLGAALAFRSVPVRRAAPYGRMPTLFVPPHASQEVALRTSV